MRNAKGNMLIMVSVFMALIAVLVLLACSFGAIYFEHTRLQQSANEIALAGARKLNENDRVGQMNNMIARCRQLVFCSTQNFNDVDTSYHHLHHLAEQLDEEARDSAMLLETERHQLATLSRSEANDAMEAKFNEIKVSYPMSLPWIKVSTPTVASQVEGKLHDVQSNVAEMKGFHELELHDAAYPYLQSYADGVKLYKEHTNARLPGTDASLNFKIASLPAPVAATSGISLISAQTTVSAARAVLASKFRNIDSDELPSACQVTLSLGVSTTLGASSQSHAQAIGTAVVTGGGLPL